MRDGVRLATDVYLPDGPGPFPTLVDRVRGGRSSAFIVGVLLLNPLDAVERGYAVVVQEVRGRAGSEASLAPLRARARGRGGLPRLGAGAAVVRRPDRHVRHRLLGVDGALPRRAPAGTRSKALAVLGTGADIHDGWVYTSGAFELGWNVYWAYMTAAETIRRLDVDDDDEGGAAARLRAGDHRRARRRGAAADLRSPAARPASARRSTASGSSTRTTTTTGRRSTSSRSPSGCAPRCSRSSAGTTTSSSRTSTSTAPLAGQAPHRLVVGPWEHTSYVSPFSTSRSGAVEFGPGRGLRRRALDAARARLVRPLDHGRRQRRRGRRPLLAARRGRVARGRAPGRRRTPRSAGTSARGGGANSRDGDGVLALGPAAGDEAPDSYLLRPARPGPDRGRQDADADDPDGRDRGSGRGRGAPGRALLHLAGADGARRRARARSGSSCGRHPRQSTPTSPRSSSTSRPTGGPSTSPTGSCAPATASRPGAARSRSRRASRPCSRSTSGISRTRSSRATGSGSRSARATSLASTGTEHRQRARAATGPATSVIADAAGLPRRGRPSALVLPVAISRRRADRGQVEHPRSPRASTPCSRARATRSGMRSSPVAGQRRRSSSARRSEPGC